MTDKTARKMPVGRPFPPGVSGNPNGRPAGRSIVKRCRELLEKPANVEDYGDATNLDLIAIELIRQAKAGDLKAITLLIERTEGKLPQPTTNQTTLTVVDAMQAVEAIEKAMDGRPDEPTTEGQP